MSKNLPDMRIRSDAPDKPDAYQIDGLTIVGRCASVHYVQQELGCSMNEALKFVDSLPEKR